MSRFRKIIHGEGRAALLALALLIAAPLAFHADFLFHDDRVIPWDFTGFHLPHLSIMKEALIRGEFPFWDPYSYCGRPFAANPQTEVFYPPRWVTVLLAGGHDSMVSLFEWEVVLHILLAGVLAALLARTLNLGWAAAALAGVGFSCGCFFASQIQHPGAVEGGAWLPLAWLGAVRIARDPSFRNLLLLTAALSVVVLTGCSPGLLIVFVSSGLLCLLLTSGRGASVLRPTLLFGAAAILSVALVAFQFLPSLEFAMNSVGKYRLEWRGTGGGIPWEAFVSLVSPNYYGVADLGTFRLNYGITTCYLFGGFAGLLLVLRATPLALCDRTVRAPMVLLAIAAVCLLGDRTFIGLLVWNALPGLIRAAYYPQYWLMAFSLSFALVAAFALDRISLRPGLKALVPVLTAVELIWFGAGMQMNGVPYTNADKVTREAIFGDRDTATALAASSPRKTAPARRFDIVEENIALVTTNALAGLLSANGYDPLALERLIQARLHFAEGRRWGAFYRVENPDSAMLEAMSVDYLVSRTPLPSGSEIKWEQAQSGERLVYQRREPSRRFWFVPEVVSVGDMHQAAAAVKHPSWTPRRTAVVEGGAMHSEKVESLSVGSVTLLSQTPNETRLKTANAGPGFLFVSEAFYPGWRARVSGRDVPVLPANVAFQGIRVPPGEHEVVLRFHPAIFWQGGVISAGCLFGLLAFALWRRRPPEGTAKRLIQKRPSIGAEPPSRLSHLQ